MEDGTQAQVLHLAVRGVHLWRTGTAPAPPDHRVFAGSGREYHRLLQAKRWSEIPDLLLAGCSHAHPGEEGVEKGDHRLRRESVQACSVMLGKCQVFAKHFINV